MCLNCSEDTPLHVSGLKPSTHYVLKVRAVNEVGAGLPDQQTAFTESIRKSFYLSFIQKQDSFTSTKKNVDENPRH
jgi:hypothetical protein